MSYLKNIVKYINSALKANIQCDDTLYIDIAQPAYRYQEEKLQSFPVYIDEKGNEKYVGPDDDYGLMIYHRVLNISVRKANAGAVYGDSKFQDAHIARMYLVAFLKHEVLKMSADELAIYMHAVLPEAATKEMLNEMNFTACNINLQEINLNDKQVFGEEFTGFQYFLKPTQSLFKMSYTIESAFLKKCFKKCPC